MFSITGDKLSTVDFIPAPLGLPEEERTREASEGLISESERLRREEAFFITRGLSSSMEYTFGTHKTNDLFGKISINSSNSGFSAGIINRSSEENTPDNMAPLSQEFDAAGYYNASNNTHISLDFGLLREDDDALGFGLRPGSRELNLYRASISLGSSMFEKWDINGRLSFRGGTFKNFGIVDEEDETVVSGGISTTGNLHDVILLINTSGKYIKLGDSSGTAFSAGALGEWLFMNALGIKIGADFHAFAMPYEDTVSKVYPVVNIDLAITPHAYIKLDYKPGIKTYSFSDIYDNNGLVTMNVPMLFEERSVDFEGEFGVRFLTHFTASAGGFAIKTKRPPVYSRSGDFFDVVKDAEIDLSGFVMKSTYDRKNIMGLDFELKFTNASWASGNFSGEVPYIPGMEAGLEGYFIPHRLWKIRASLLFYGEHYLEINSDDKEKSFYTLDIGVDRQLWKKYISMYMDLRNITKSKGSWWTDKYKIPGIGLYVGIKAHY